ncbi:G-type lectin S-receptor-like serine/threonine-protein kinase At4g27290 [Mangifera indica]|uniref:G-type lectin S-receptor-like serine/threonine-protein kinase At4g27290 n=1 Tax=Mangifera indica TaxID=29780 RepID=UPI001CFA8B4D|nr:G-type lectin S-receptor-like serine/threonine-protein kinase At4g27290 [Mangifera indica]
MDFLYFMFISFKFLFLFLEFSYAADTINSTQSLSDASGTTLISNGGTFEFGFFSPGNNPNRYLGIWYKDIPVKTVVWVANRLNPVNDSSGLLMINSSGNPLLMDQNTSVVWSVNFTKQVSSSGVVLQLLDTGNLVLRDEQDANSETNYLWQSFDYPSDTLLPGMKLGWDLRTGFERRLTSWISPDDPSPGDFIWELVPQENPELIMWKGSTKFFRSGPWNGLRFSGAPELRPNPVFVFSFVSNDNELYYTYNVTDDSVISRIVMNQTEYQRDRFTWSETTQSWTVYATVPRDRCDNYGLCGPYGVCILSDSPICQCLEGFTPRSPGNVDWSQGCVRNKPLNLSAIDGFIKFEGLKLPDANHSWVNASMNLKECELKCSHNSSCMAYSNSNVEGAGSGCTMWFGDLIDMRQMTAAGQQDLYIRMSASELGSGDGKKKTIAIIFTTIGVIAGVLVLILSYFIYRRRQKKTSEKTEINKETDNQNEDQHENLELPLFELATIVKVTRDFSLNNKLGEGGFGPVYHGKLENGQEIAVKRLSAISGQGLNEFKNEVILIANLQHRNLVKLLGCCIQGEEKLLIYEFMPNKSLDNFIFDKKGRKLLDWSKRFNIICGIARGLLYLHQDSRLRIIHRDLKASNVLLDHEMNPKISDFGLARTFGGDQTEGNTKRVVGTFGYMAPEYATDGLFSVKSDVFSFGILVLEIVSGIRNRGLYHLDESLNLVGYAWKLWKEDKPLEIIDSMLGESCHLSEVIRCIHISLLCVQQYPEDRPNMSSVFLMLGGDGVLTQPKQPGFLMDRKLHEIGSTSSKPESSSTNEITMSLLEAR